MNTHDQWISSGHAHNLLLRRSTLQTPAAALMRRLEAGELQAKADSLQSSGEIDRGAMVPPDFWSGGLSAFVTADWATGDFIRRSRTNGDAVYGLKLNRRQIEAMCDLQDLSDKTGKDAGGRPTAAWWDDFWVFVLTELYYGRFEFETQSQADLVRLMLDWAVAHGCSLSESHATTKERKLLSALREGKNFEG